MSMEASAHDETEMLAHLNERQRGALMFYARLRRYPPTGHRPVSAGALIRAGLIVCADHDAGPYEVTQIGRRLAERIAAAVVGGAEPG